MAPRRSKLPLPLPDPPPVTVPQENEVGRLRLPPPVTGEVLDKSPAPSGEEIYAATVSRLTMGDRTDFVNLLARMLKCSPSEEALTRYAERFPDRFMQAMAINARLAGFTDKLEVKHSGTLAGYVEELTNLSDADLFRRAQEAGIRTLEPINVAAKNLERR